MHEIERVLRKAGRRLLIVDLFRTLTVTFTVGAAALIVALMLERVFGLLVPWRQVMIGAAVLSVVGAVVWSLVRQARGLALAREVDERAGLRESLSTAMCVTGNDSPWARVVVETARQRAMRVVVRDAVPYESPRLWPMPVATLVAFGLLYMIMPNIDLSGQQQARVEDREEQANIIEAKRDVQKLEKDLEDLLKKASIEMDTEEDETGDPEATADEVRLQSIRKLTKLEDQVKQSLESESAKQAEAMRQMMRRLKTPGPGPLDQMSKELAQGNFSEAKKALDELSAQLAGGEMSDSDREKLSKQLANMSQQLEKLAEQQDQLEQALKEAGMSAQEAKAALSDPAQLEKAMDKLENLSPEQKQSLMNQVKAQQSACQSCQGLADSLEKMGMAAGQGDPSQAAQSAAGAGGMLSEMEMMEGELAALEASLDKLGEGMCELAGQCSGSGNGMGEGKWGPTNPWRAGEANGLGNGSGGPGRGNGASPDEQVADYTIEKDKANIKRKNGPITGQRWVYGNQNRGESNADFKQAVVTAQETATEALESQQVEQEYRDAVENYFSTLESDGDDE